MINSRWIKRFVGTALAASITVLAMVPSASAHHPTGVFAKFAQCPFESSTVALCTYSESTSGVTSTEELVGETHLSLTNLLFEEGTALEVPLVLHMKNSLLGSECFIVA